MEFYSCVAGRTRSRRNNFPGAVCLSGIEDSDDEYGKLPRTSRSGLKFSDTVQRKGKYNTIDVSDSEDGRLENKDTEMRESCGVPLNKLVSTSEESKRKKIVTPVYEVLSVSSDSSYSKTNMDNAKVSEDSSLSSGASEKKEHVLPVYKDESISSDSSENKMSKESFEASKDSLSSSSGDAEAEGNAAPVYQDTGKDSAQLSEDSSSSSSSSASTVSLSPSPSSSSSSPPPPSSSSSLPSEASDSDDADYSLKARESEQSYHSDSDVVILGTVAGGNFIRQKAGKRVSMKAKKMNKHNKPSVLNKKPKVKSLIYETSSESYEYNGDREDEEDDKDVTAAVKKGLKLKKPSTSIPVKKPKVKILVTESRACKNYHPGSANGDRVDEEDNGDITAPSKKGRNLMMRYTSSLVKKPKVKPFVDEIHSDYYEYNHAGGDNGYRDDEEDKEDIILPTKRRTKKKRNSKFVKKHQIKKAITNETDSETHRIKYEVDENGDDKEYITVPAKKGRKKKIHYKRDSSVLIMKQKFRRTITDETGSENEDKNAVVGDRYNVKNDKLYDEEKNYEIFKKGIKRKAFHKKLWNLGKEKYHSVDHHGDDDDGMEESGTKQPKISEINTSILAEKKTRSLKKKSFCLEGDHSDRDDGLGESSMNGERYHEPIRYAPNEKNKGKLETFGDVKCYEEGIDSTSPCDEYDDGDDDMAGEDDIIDDMDEFVDDDGENCALSCVPEERITQEEEITKIVLKTCKNKKQDHAPRFQQVYKIFVDSIWDQCELPQENPENTEVPPQEAIPPPILLRKFKFGVVEPEPVVKSDYEKQLDVYWDIMEFAMEAKEIGSYKTLAKNKEGNEDVHVTKAEMEADPSSLCRKGTHRFVLDEQVGLKCTICLFVAQEIRHILPPLVMNRSERVSGKRYAREGESSTLDVSMFQDILDGSNNQYDQFKGTVWDRFPCIKENLYQHQQEGFEFLWNNIAGGIELDQSKNNANSHSIGGCVISHAPGTGKTFLTLAFLKTYMTVFKDIRPVILAPSSMLLTWEGEFRKWKVDIPFHNYNSTDYSGKEHPVALRMAANCRSTNMKRMVKLLSWSKGNSILGISYTLFEKLAGQREVDRVQRSNDEEEVQKILCEKPSLLILDEGHTPRNERSRIWKAFEYTKTDKRVILSGTPFQNNFDELYNTMCLVRPKFADKISLKTQKFGRKGLEHADSREKWSSLTSKIGKLSDDKLLEEVKSMIAPFVHVHRGDILKKSLPGLRECVVVLNPPHLQKYLLEKMEGVPDTFKLEHHMTLVSIHPSLLVQCNYYEHIYGEFGKAIMEKIMSSSFRLNPEEGVKIRFLMAMIRLAIALDEKVLVFSQYHEPFNLIKDQLGTTFNWNEGKEFLQMDGNVNVKLRQQTMSIFNDPKSKVKVLLASTKACREGINLIGASRVVLLDVVWNPSVERQAISRAYRLGQKKIVYTYHLITTGKMEGDKYKKQIGKDRMSELVFSLTDEHGSKLTGSLSNTDDEILEAIEENEDLKDIFCKVIYQPKESNLVDAFGSASLPETKVDTSSPFLSY